MPLPPRPSQILPPRPSQIEVASPRNVHFANENGGYFTQKSNNTINTSIQQTSLSQPQPQPQPQGFGQEKPTIISILNEKLTNMNNEVTKLASQSQSLQLKDNSLEAYMQSNAIGNGDELCINKLSMLTQSEKEVKQVKVIMI